MDAFVDERIVQAAKLLADAGVPLSDLAACIEVGAEGAPLSRETYDTIVGVARVFDGIS
jgi:hypothetical protein